MCVFLFLHRLAAWVPERRAGRRERGILKILNKACLLNWTRASRISLTARVSEAYFVFFKTHILGWRSLLVNAGAEMTSEHHLLKLFSQSTFNLGFQNNKVLCLMISPFFLIALITPKAKSKLHHILTYKWKSSAVSFFISWREVHKFDNFHLPKVHIFHDGIFLTSTNNINNELLLLLSFLNPLRGT